MMFAKTFCRPGAFMTIIPIGLQVTLQYDREGKLEKIYTGYDEMMNEASKEFLTAVRKEMLVPLTIKIKQGTSYIKGVFYTDSVIAQEGFLPYCNNSDMIDGIINKSIDVKFYAAQVDSRATPFKSVTVIRDWLKMSGFEVLPGYVVPVNLTDKAFKNLVYTDKYPFGRLSIGGYLFFDGTEIYYRPSNMKQYLVDKVTKFTDPSGYIKGKVETKSGTLTVNYSDVVSFDIQRNTLITTDKDNHIMFTEPTDTKKRDPRSAKLKCDVCGLPFTCPKSGPVTCPDENCRSRMWNNLNHFLNVLKLPELDGERFKKAVSDGNIIAISDILSYEEYESMKVNTTFTSILRACTPVSICGDVRIFKVVSDACGESVQSLRMYSNNPKSLLSYMPTTNLSATRLVNWIAEPKNLLLIETVLDTPNIEVIKEEKAFQGAPIFRGSTILITGDFSHGNTELIQSIIASYNAKVVTEYNDDVSILVIGDLKSNINGSAVIKCRERFVQSYTESEFFDKFEIDEDIQNNLL